MSTIVIGTAGHIDHGKSTLVQALTGTDPDRLKEEKDRGITIDLGFAHYRDEDGTVLSFVDVPGHERFVKNMLAGVSGIHAVLLVIAADESVMPQSREHFDICRLLHVARGVIALTKSDLVDPEMIELARLEVKELVAGSFLADAPVVPVSAKTGSGLAELRAALREVMATTTAAGGGPAAVRLPIDRVFSMRGFGTVVTGTLVSGQIDLDRDLRLLPSGRRVKVRGLQVHGASQAVAAAGRRVAVNLGGLDVADVSRGDSLVTPGSLEVTRRFDGVVELLSSAKPLRHGARIRFHHGTCEVMGRVAVAGPLTSPARHDAARESGRGVEIEPGTGAYVRVRLESPVVLTRGDRYILRAYSPPTTIAGGLVLDPQPPRIRIRTAAARQRFERLRRALEGKTPAERLAAAARVVVEEQAALGLPVQALVVRLGAPPDLVDQAVAQLRGAGVAMRVGELLIASGVLKAGRTHVLAAIDAHHRDQPLSEGLPREEARERLFGRAHPSVFEQVIADLVGAGAITARDRLARSTHRVSLSDDEVKAQAAIEGACRTAGLTPPDLASLAEVAGVAPEVAERVAKWLMRQKVLVKVEALVFHTESLRTLKAEIAALKPKGSSEPARIDVGTFKARYGITRKYAIPLLEYLDRERITRRVGQSRVVL